MHATIRSLLELDDVNRQRQILVKRRREREARLAKTKEQAEQAQRVADQAADEAHRADALIRQYEADVQRCDQTIEKLRGQQMEASTNKAYLACLNGIEAAKNEKKLREESLLKLMEQTEELQAKADEAKSKAENAAGQVGVVEQEIAAQAEADASEAELDRIYQEKKQHCEPKYLEIYERLVQAGNPRPIMKVDPRTRATPLGNCINTNALESLRLGQLITDPACNAILYVDED